MCVCVCVWVKLELMECKFVLNGNYIHRHTSLGGHVCVSHLHHRINSCLTPDSLTTSCITSYVSIYQYSI